MKLTFFLFLFILKTAYSQANEVASILTNCKQNVVLSNDFSTKLPQTETTLLLPEKWCADFYGELPMLHAQKNDSAFSFNLIANQAWDSFPKGELFILLKKSKDVFSFKEFNYHNHTFLLTEQAENKYQLHYHIDDSEEFENRWTWVFKFKLENTSNVNILCEVNFIIKQIVETYDN